MTQIKRSIPALALSAAAFLFPSLVMAQGFGDPAPPPGSTDPAPVTTPPPAPVYQPEPTPPPAVESQAEAEAEVSTGTDVPMAAVATTPRPEGLSFGLGFNYILGGAELDRPSGASLRVRLVSGLTFEPFVRLATHGQSSGSGVTEVENAQNEFIVGTNARLPLKSRGKVDLVAQVGGGLGVFIDDPEGDDNNTTTTTFTIDYGLSLEYWYNNNWVLSFTARNQFVRYQGTSQEISGADDFDTSSTDLGIIWDPVVEAALHLFF